MQKNTSLLLWLIIVHAFICFGAGHGVATIAVLEIGYLLSALHVLDIFSPRQWWGDYWFWIALLTLLGQILVALAIRSLGRSGIVVVISAIIFLLTSVILLMVSVQTTILTISSAIPFLIVAGVILKKLLSNTSSS